MAQEAQVVNLHVQRAYAVDQMPEDGMAFLRGMFPTGEADEMNFVLFSTSGTHGSYLTIEDVAASLETSEPERLTVLVIQPRVVRMVYGHIAVEPRDIEFLLRLRTSSYAALQP